MLLTLTVSMDWLQQPLLSVPVTVQLLVTLGVTTIELEVAEVFHEYVLAPLALRVLLPPTQTKVLDITGTTLGSGLTKTTTEVFVLHCCTLVPVKVYTVVRAGETAILDEDAEVLHEQVFAPDAVKTVVCCPIQMEGEAGVKVKTGFA